MLKRLDKFDVGVQIHDEEAEGFLKRDNIARHLL
jgi:hypothetical protein